MAACQDVNRRFEPGCADSVWPVARVLVVDTQESYHTPGAASLRLRLGARVGDYQPQLTPDPKCRASQVSIPRPEMPPGSLPKAGDAERIHALFDADIRANTDTLGVAARREDGAVVITYPVAVFA